MPGSVEVEIDPGDFEVFRQLVDAVCAFLDAWDDGDRVEVGVVRLRTALFQLCEAASEED